MSWEVIGIITPSAEWQYTEVTSSSLVRVKSAIVPLTKFSRGEIAVIRGTEVINSRRLWALPAIQVIDLGTEVIDFRIGFRVAFNRAESWIITIEQWNQPMSSRFLADVRQEDLIEDKAIVSHNQNADYTDVTVYDSKKNIVQPYNIRSISSSEIEIDFRGLTPITGVYKVYIS